MNTHFTAIQKEYVSWLETLNFTPTTTSSLGFRLVDFFEWLKNKNITSINCITQNHLIEFLEYQQTRPNTRYKDQIISQAYVNIYAIAINKFCEFLHQMGAKTTLVPTNYRTAHDEAWRINKIEPFSIEEIKLLQAKINDIYPRFELRKANTKTRAVKVSFCPVLRLRITKKRGL